MPLAGFSQDLAAILAQDDPSRSPTRNNRPSSTGIWSHPDRERSGRASWLSPVTTRWFSLARTRSFCVQSLTSSAWLISLLAGPLADCELAGCPVAVSSPLSRPALPRWQPRNEAPGGASSDWEDGSSLRGFPDRDGADEEEEEDVFGASSETGPRHSGFSPVRGSPFPQENRSLCGNGLYCVEDVNACPTSTPRHTLDGGRSVWKGSPNVSGISQDSPCRVYPPAAHQLDVEDEGQAAGTALFMPRNLLSLFDQSIGV
ncbi:uncharacterized protein [Chiloscyllium punctatum]|uniref:uncharacterized protein n=1 Tax=Chiloscyllium punctatum TaxID=137246 RepID=UPI003B634DA8